MTPHRRTTGAAAGLALTAGLLAATATPAHADVSWQVLPTGTAETITAADYRGSRIVFATATGKIFTGTDAGGFVLALDAPGVAFTDLALNPAGDRGVAVADNRIWRFDGTAWSEAAMAGVTYNLQTPTNVYPNGYCPNAPAAPGTYPAADLHPAVDLVDVEWVSATTAYAAAFGAESMLLGTSDGGATWSERGRDSAGNCLFKGEGLSRQPALESTPGVAWYIHRGDIFKSADGFATAPKVDLIANKTDLAVDPANPLRQLAWQEDVHYTSGAITTTGSFTAYEWLNTTTPGKHDGTQALRDVVAAPGVFYAVGTGGMVERIRTHTDIERIPVPGHGATEWRDAALNGAGRLMVAGGSGVVAVTADPTAPLTVTAPPPPPTTTPIPAPAPAPTTATLPPPSKPPVAGTPVVKGGYAIIKVRGTLGRPAGVSQAAACRGKVKVTFTKPRTRRSPSRVIKRAKVLVNSRCVYQKKVRIKRSTFADTRRLRMTVVFPGNAAMGPTKASYAIRVRG